MTDYLYRKYIDLMREASNSFINWDPLYQVTIGTYGLIDPETGRLKIEGNVYDPGFKRELELDEVDIKMKDFRPVVGPVEDDKIITTRGAVRKDWDPSHEAAFPAGAKPIIKGKWLFERRDKREAILIMHKPRQIFMPRDSILEHLYKLDALVEKVLVTGVYTCPAYSMYLSEKSTHITRSSYAYFHHLPISPPDTTDNTISIALLSQTPDAAGAGGGLSWWINSTEDGVFRHACHEKGDYAFTTLSTMKRPIKRIRRSFVGPIQPDPTGDDLWYNENPSWEPLDEDGDEDPIDPSVQTVDPFEHVFAEAIKRNDPRLPRFMRKDYKPPPPVEPKSNDLDSDDDV